MRQPSLDECRFYAAQIGLVPLEAEKFFHFFESNGWMVGRNPMKRWESAMITWKLRAQQQQEAKKTPSTSMQLVIWRDELKRVEERLLKLRNSYSENQSWSPEDQAIRRTLINRRKRLLENLGMSI